MRILKFLNQASHDNLVASTVNLLSLLEVKAVTSSVRDTLLRNTNYPSLFAVSESLNYLKVANEAYKLDSDKLNDLPTPFIAQLRDNSGDFVVVKAVNKDFVTYLNNEAAEQKVTAPEFQNRWNGIALLAEASENSGQSDYKQVMAKKRLQRVRVAVFALLAVIAGIVQFAITVPNLTASNLNYYISAWIFTACGSFVTSLLLWYEYDRDNPYLKKICSIHKTTNCNAVLTSKGAKIAGFSWSELGAFYFFGTLFYLVIVPYSSFFLLPLVFLNIIAFPYIFFSVYYQGMVVKQWCVLCLVVQGVLLFEFLAVILTGQLTGNIFAGLGALPFSYLGIAFLLPPLIWVTIKPYLYDKKENDDVKYKFLRFKSNPEVFDSILSKQTAIKTEPFGLGITIGNQAADNILIKVCNPFCGPCGQYFPDLLDVINANANLKVQIVFTGKPDKNDRQAVIIAHLLHIDKNKPELTIRALTDWYTAKVRDYDQFRVSYADDVVFEQYQENIAGMYLWCKNEEIQFTPTYYINGRRLPDSYSLKDLAGMFNQEAFI